MFICLSVMAIWRIDNAFVWPSEMRFAPTEMRNCIVILANLKTESFVHRWQHAHAIVWRNILSRICWSIGGRLKHFVDRLIIIDQHHIYFLFLLFEGHRESEGTAAEVPRCAQLLPGTSHLPGWRAHQSGRHHSRMWPASRLPVCKCRTRSHLRSCRLAEVLTQISICFLNLNNL